MNKILIDTSQYDLLITKEDFYSLDIVKNTNLKIKVLDNIKVNLNLLIKNCNVKLNINLENNSNVFVNQLGINTSLDININLGLNSYLKYINSLITKVDSLNNININHLKENSNSSIIVNGINTLDKKLYLTMNGHILKESINSKLEESSRIINLSDGDSKIIPNLFIDNEDVVANHSAFIGNFNENDIYYLKSRGLNKEQVDNLLLKATLLNGMNLIYDKDKFINVIINKEWR